MKSKILVLLGVVTSILAQAQDLYDLNTIQTIEITFAQSNWDALLDAEKAGNEDYIMAQSVAINGVVFDSIGVKYKGNSTYNPNNTKNPFHIELDTYKDHIYGAYTDIKLSNAYNDPSFVREVLSYQILRQYMDAPLSNYANVFVNGSFIGLYSNSESVSKKFLKSRFASKTNTFVKCSPPDGAGPGTSDYPNLVYQGQDSADYYDAYELKSDEGWNELINLTDTLANDIAHIEEILDVDRALWMLAFNNVLVNLDSYSGAFSQNYYLYKDDYNKFLSVVWDLNESFGRFSMTGTSNLNNTAQKQQMTHLLHQNDSGFPLIQKLLSVPMYKRMYLAHMKTMVTENFSDGSYFATGQTYQALVDSSVQADNNKFYSYANFISNLTSDVNSGGGPQASSTPGITNLMDARSTYLMSQTDFTNVEPTISNVSFNSSAAPGQTVTVTAEVSDENTVYLGYRNIEHAPFTRVLMYDDGAHNDGAANDGVYGLDLSLNSPTVQFYIYAENSNIGKFSPVRAEHEFHTITAISELVINEFMADNDNVISDQHGEYEDWIELYNNSSDSIYLGDYYLTDDAGDPTQWKLPEEYIQSGGFKLFWASGDPTLGTNHADFKLSKSGEEIGLYYDNGSSLDTTDYISFGAQSTDISYGRSYDASPDWVFFDTSTPDASNGKSTSIEKINVTGLRVYPNPYRSTLFIENTTKSVSKITVYSVVGQVLSEIQLNPFETYEWKDQSKAGLRILLIQNENGSEVLKVISQ